MEVQVVRSARRRKTVAWRQVDGVLRVSIPAALSQAEQDRWVAHALRHAQRKALAAPIDLAARAAALAARYDLPAPAAVRWVSNQERRWASCTPGNGAVRVSDRLAAWPPWVLDYVLVHELAHLAVADHSPAFWALVGRYPKAERARGYLIAKGVEAEQ